MSLVVVQRGHVPRTTGATGAPGEQQFAIDTAAKLAPMLTAMGHDVRVINADVSLSEYRGDLFVAIHYDSSSSSSASGASVGYQNRPGARLAEMWKRHYVAEDWTRGFRDDNYSANLGGYYGVRNAIGQGNEAAIITESGFHSNAGDKALMSPTRTARSIAAAVAEYTGTTPKEEDEMQLNDEINLKGEHAGEILGMPKITVDGALGYSAAALKVAEQVAVAVGHLHDNMHLVNDKVNALQEAVAEILAEVKQ